MPLSGAGAASIYQRASDALTATSSRVDQQARGTLDSLQVRIERQDLIIQTLLMILLEKKVIHEDEFKEWMIYMDELDGVRDGRLRPDKTPVVCPGCSRNSPSSSPKCVYCGHEFEPEFLLRRPNKAG